MMARLLWRAVRFSERLGATGWLSLGIALFLLLFFVLEWLPAKNELKVLNMQQSHLSHEVKIPPSPENSLLRFSSQFPPSSERAACVQKMMKLAESMGLSIEEISYKTEQRQDDIFNHYHIDFSLIAAYPEMRKFLSRLLFQTPNASLDSIAISRENLNDEITETRVRLTLHFIS